MPEGNTSEDQPELCSEDNLLLTGILNNLFYKLKGIQQTESEYRGWKDGSAM